ncbi:MAG TPA: aconitate hydratase AcnA [Porticoccaceae bacterium]|nr:aconitate hydratase AcnA [Porticoccaceae bacterium]
MKISDDRYQIRKTLSVNGKAYQYWSLKSLEQQGFSGIAELPYSLKILLENILRGDDGTEHARQAIETLGNWQQHRGSEQEIAFRPSRVLMQDFTGVPAIVDLAAMRDALTRQGRDPSLINPLTPVDLVIDHSVMVDRYAEPDAYEQNVRIEMLRNAERYQFLRWGQTAFDNFRVVPPGTGICHQVNLEYLAKSVWVSEYDGQLYAYPDTLVGTDSHTTMINALGVLGWGVGGIEAEAAMLGQAVTMLIPEVVGFKLTGRLKEGVTATDLVLTVVEKLRQHGVVGKFVEFFGSGLDFLPLADRATIANMAPEYGATCGFFTIDQETLNYLRLSGREEDSIMLVEHYAKEQGIWRDSSSSEPVYDSTLVLDLNEVVPCVAGPRRPQDRVALNDLPQSIEQMLALRGRQNRTAAIQVTGEHYQLRDGDVVIAAITSCTNTSNPAVMLAAGLIAKKATALGLNRKPWVKTSLAPGSKVVTDYLREAGLQSHLDQLGFNLVGYGCTTCIGNSGPLHPAIEDAIDAGDLSVCSVLSGNRNFEGRIHPKVRGNWLASPPLVVLFALAGTTCIDMSCEAITEDQEGKPVFLKDLWPSNDELSKAMRVVQESMFQKQYANVFSGDAAWQQMTVSKEKTYSWNADSTYIQCPPFFSTEHPKPADIRSARIIAVLGDSVTTDHISPAGSIALNSPAGGYLQQQGVEQKDFNSYGSRRGNHEVMMRGTFANVRIRNEMVPGVEGGVTRLLPDGEQMPIYDAAMRYQQAHTPLVVIAGKEYGTGSSRDWAAKGTRLLGIKAVIAESFERIHRSNLIGMGVLPLQFIKNDSRRSLGIDGTEIIDITGLSALEPGCEVRLSLLKASGEQLQTELLCRIDTEIELDYFQSGGILNFVLEGLGESSSA